MTPSSKPINPIQEAIDAFAALKGVGRMFWVCNAVYLMDGAAYFGILNVLTLFLGQSVGLPDEMNGRYASVLSGGVTAFGALFGFLSDKWGVRRTMTISILVAVVGRVLLALSGGMAQGPAVAFVALIFMAFSAGVLTPAVYAGVKQATNAQTSALGFSLVYALMNGGIVVESLVSSEVRKAYGTSGVMWMCAGITLLYLALHLIFFPAKEGQPVQAPTQAVAATQDRRHALFNPRFLFFIFVLLGVRTLFAHQWLTMPDYVTRAYPAAVGERFEWINALNPFIILFGTPLVAAFTARIHVVTMMIMGTLISASATFMLIGGPDLTMLLGYVIVFSIGEAMWSSRFLEYVAGLAPPDKVGVYMGVAQIPWFLAKFTTGFYSGYMLRTFCPAEGPKDTGTMWLIYGIIGMSSPIGLILAAKWLKKGDLAKQATA